MRPTRSMRIQSVWSSTEPPLLHLRTTRRSGQGKRGMSAVCVWKAPPLGGGDRRAVSHEIQVILPMVLEASRLEAITSSFLMSLIWP